MSVSSHPQVDIGDVGFAAAALKSNQMVLHKFLVRHIPTLELLLKHNFFVVQALLLVK